MPLPDDQKVELVSRYKAQLLMVIQNKDQLTNSRLNEVVSAILLSLVHDVEEHLEQ